ncbi:MAG: hypothetical protein ACI9KE_006125 [Polyangiales bacterium]
MSSSSGVGVPAVVQVAVTTGGVALSGGVVSTTPLSAWILVLVKRRRFARP